MGIFISNLNINIFIIHKYKIIKTHALRYLKKLKFLKLNNLIKLIFIDKPHIVKK